MAVTVTLFNIIMIIIAFKGAIRDSLQSPHCTANCPQHVSSSGPGAIVYKSRAAHRALITCKMSCATWYEGTAQLSSLTELKSHLFELYSLAEPLADEGGEETGVPRKKTLTTSFRKCHILKPENSSPNRDSNPHSSIGGR